MSIKKLSLLLFPVVINFNMFFWFQIYAAKNPHGAESLPPGIVVPQTDLYLTRLWGDPFLVRYVYTRTIFS